MTPAACEPRKWYLVSFSGGKDSVATYLHLTRELRLPHVVAVFSDTGHESDVTHDYVWMLAREHGFKIVRVQPTLEDMRGELNPVAMAERLGLLSSGITPDHPSFWHLPLSMERLAILKRRFPSPTRRFCTTHLKLLPLRRHMLQWCEWNDVPLSDVIRVSGVRAEESTDRAARPIFEPLDIEFGVPLWLPIHKWTWQEVFAIHDRYGVPANPLYKSGCSRVGCFPCINVRKSELAALATYHPAALDDLQGMETRVAAAAGKDVMTFFSTGKTPAKYASHRCEKTDKPINTADDVRRWALGELPVLSDQQELFAEDWTEDAAQCLSMYGLCE